MNGHPHHGLMQQAAKAMGKNYFYSSQAGFVCDDLRWLAKTLGDVHLEFHACEGWQISTCFEEEGWKNWITQDTDKHALAECVAKAILATKSEED